MKASVKIKGESFEASRGCFRHRERTDLVIMEYQYGGKKVLFMGAARIFSGGEGGGG